MRFNACIQVTAIAISVIFAGNSNAQTIEIAPATIQTPSIIQGSQMVADPGVIAPAANAIMQLMPSSSAPAVMNMNAQPQFASPNVYSSVVSNSSAYGPTMIGTASGCGCCNMTPVPTVVPNLAPVTSCCGSLGRLGVPALLTPPQSYSPPVGRQYGRPVFGKWSGF